MRLFIAICLSGEMRAALEDMQRQMRIQRVAGRYAPPENLHLTLAFLGEYPDPDAVPLPPMRPFPLELEGYGSFGDLWWAGVRPSGELDRYAATLRRSLAQEGIPFDRKRFSPHITLLRRGVGAPALRVPAAGMVADHASLMRSDRGKAGMIYTELRTSEPWRPPDDETRSEPHETL